MSTTKAPFPPIRRVVTGRTSAGRSTVIADNVEPARPLVTRQSSVYTICITARSPAVIDTEISKGKWVDEIKTHPELVSAWDRPSGVGSPAWRRFGAQPIQIEGVKLEEEFRFESGDQGAK
ncbi:hypothetical protein C8R46DRAFT_1197717 [Mycena filopes]|nr:hypothetical protein C8R46DRAFT_1197717 [Mycena filopes]